MIRKISPPQCRRWAQLVVGFAALGSASRADDVLPAAPKAEAVLRRTADFFAAAKSFAVEDQRTQQIGVMPIRQTAQVSVERPAKLAVRAKGLAPGMIECVTDGTTLHLVLPFPIRRYSADKAPASLDILGADMGVKMLAMSSSVGSMLTELIMADPARAIRETYGIADYVGLEELDGAKVHHLRFDHSEANPAQPGDTTRLIWDVWIAADGDPVPVKTHMNLSQDRKGRNADEPMDIGHRLGAWRINPTFDAATFAFVPPAGFAEMKEHEPGKVREVDDEQDAPSPLVGKPAPAIDLKLAGGGDFRLADRRDKEIVLVDFWATWCRPCVRELPDLVDVAATYRDRGVALMTINSGEDAAKVATFQAEKQLAFPVALDPDEVAGQAYGVTGIPTCVLIDKQGTIRAVHIGYSPRIRAKLAAEIDALLAGKEIPAAR